MKNISVLVLTLCCVLSLCACGTTSQPTPPPTEVDNTTPPETEEIIVDAESTTTPSDEKEAKQALFQDVFANKQYTMSGNAIRATMSDSYSFAQLAAIQNENKMLWSVRGVLPDGYVEADLYQNEMREFFFRQKTVQGEVENETWYKCTNTEGYDITQNLFDISFFINALAQTSSIEYVDTANHRAHVIVYSDMKAEGAEESDAQTVFDVFIDETLFTIDSIRFYDDGFEWLIVFVNPEQAVLYIPEDVIFEEMNITDAQQEMDENTQMVQTPIVFEEN